VCHSLGDADFELATSPTWGDGSAGDDADIAAVLAYDFKKADAVRAYVQPLVIETGKGRVLVDTGNGPRPDASGNASSRLRTTLAAAGLKASDIDVVVLTHLHGDHTGGLLDEKGQELFAKAEYVVHAAELDFWSSGTPDLSKTPRLPDGWKQSIAKGAKQAADLIAPRARRVADGDEIVEGIKVMHLPGHTPGMIGLVVGSGDAQLMVANDVVHHDTLSLRRPLMPVMFDADVAQGARTRQAFLTRAAAERALVFSYHMPFPAVGRVRAEGGAFAWVAEGWKW
jgi:glyoxylase-like metal-dependent hydrolase (beta-lactamase superfamily II)